VSIITPDRKLIFFEASQFRGAVSEDMIQRQGAISNQNALFQFDVLHYLCNGAYGDVTTIPFTGLDGLYIFPFKMEIINVAIFSNIPGSSGTTELDAKLATSSGGTFTSIFSVTPKVASTASAFAYALSYDITLGTSNQIWTLNATPPTGVTVGQLTSVPLVVDAGDALRVDILGVMPGAENAGLIIYFRPTTQ
jgi:hypothetical protein